MPAESVLRQHLNSNTPGYVFLADADKNIFMEIPYSNMKEISVFDNLQNQAILNDPFAWYAPVRRYAEWTLRFGKLMDENDPTAYTIIDASENKANSDEIMALLD